MITLTRKATLATGIILVSILVCGCGFLHEDRADAADIQDQLGTIRPFTTGAPFLVIRPDADTTIAYFPVKELPEGVRRAGVRVIFSGNILPFPPDPPANPKLPRFEVTRIERVP